MAGVATFFALAFAWTWGLGIAAVLIGGPSDVARTALAMAAGFGPSLAGVAVVAAFGGRSVLRGWLARCLRWRIGWRPFAIAFLLPPAAMLGALAIHGALGGAVGASPAAGHVPLAMANFALVLLVGGPLGEEFGWRGYALPALAAHMNRKAASLIVGAVWGLWHLPLFFMAGAAQSQMPMALFMTSTVSLSVIFAALFWRSGQSVLPCLVLHTAINAFVGVIPVTPPNGEGRSYALLVGLLLVVACVLLLQPDPRRACAAKASANPAGGGPSHVRPRGPHRRAPSGGGP